MTVQLLIGTTKGGFILTSDDRRTWQVSGPHCHGWTINHMVGDPETGRIWAGGGGDFLGAGVFRSDDGGRSWSLKRLTTGKIDRWLDSEPELAEEYGIPNEPVAFGDAFSQVWSLGYDHGRLHVGTKPAQLLTSDDGGDIFEIVEPIASFPGRDTWSPGAAGLVLHTIVSDPGDASKIWIGISAVGVFASDDGGKTWERRNRLSNAADCEGHDHPAAPRDGDTGHCVHNMMRANGDGDLLYQQNHHGVWRSKNGGRSWDKITDGLPSTFGFPIRVHPRDANMIWTIPLNGDAIGRFPPDAAAAVWKSSDGGESWTAKREGLPQENCFFTVLRQAMAGDTRDPVGLYFGTNSGSIFGSFDEGESWTEITAHMPTILSLEVLET